jgi:hypothetical protein
VAVKKKKIVRPHACVILVDVENIRIPLGISRTSKSFPGKGIIGQATEEDGFFVKEAFACLNDKAAPGEVVAQSKVLADQGFVPVICPPIKDSASDAVDRMLHRMALKEGADLGVSTIIIASGDKDFLETQNALKKLGAACKIIHVSSNTAEEYRRSSNAVSIRLPGKEQDLFEFLREVLQRMSRSDIEELIAWMRSFTNEQEVAFAYYKCVVSIIQALPRNRDRTFRQLADEVWSKLPSTWREDLSYEFLHRTVSLVNNYTNVITRREKVVYIFNPSSEHLEILKEL